MDAKRADEVRDDYLVLRREVRVRMDAINRMIGDPGGYDSRVVREFCYLQLRMIAELVALACVVAHDSPGRDDLKKLRRDYHADRILKQMERRHQGFFPRASIVVQIAEGHQEIQPQDGVGFTATQMREMWAKAGDVLHFGTVNKLRSQKPVDPEQADVRGYQRRLIDLLSEHVILAQDEMTALHCVMQSEKTGNVEAMVLTALPPGFGD